MSDLISIKRWHEAQGQFFPNRMDEKVSLGPIYSDSWLRDPKHLVFALARYKFVAKMLVGYSAVAEVGAGDGFGAKLVRAEADKYRSGNPFRPSPSLRCFDISPLDDSIERYDVMSGPIPDKMGFDAIYAIDIFEHVNSSATFFMNLSQSLRPHGLLIVGTPSLEGQAYASEPSRKLHVNCMSGEELRKEARCFFRHVFMFSMNDEVVHTGFLPMAHYLWAVCAEPIR